MIRTMYHAPLAACVLSLCLWGCKRPDGECSKRVSDYAITEYSKITSYSCNMHVHDRHFELKFSPFYGDVITAKNNADEFTRLAKLHQESGARLVRLCLAPPRPWPGIANAPQSIRVIHVKAGGDTVDLSTHYILEFESYKRFIQSGYDEKFAVDSQRIPLGEATSDDLVWLTMGGCNLMEVKPLPDWIDSPKTQLQVVIRMADGQLPVLR